MNEKEKNGVTPVIIVSGETGKLPAELGEDAGLYNSKQGGQGDVIPAVAGGLIKLGIPVHLVIPNVKNQFIRRNGITDKEWVAKRHSTPSKYIHLVESNHIRNLEHIYAGDKKFTAAKLQMGAYFLVKSIRAQYERKGIVISNDDLTGGWLSAYLRTREVPLLHIVHNIHTMNIPLDNNYYHDAPMSDHQHNFFLNPNNPNQIDSHATAIKNSTYAGFVGPTFLDEIVSGTLGAPMPWTVRQEIIEKWKVGKTVSLPNGLYRDLLPENQGAIFEKYGGKKFGPNTKNLVAAKKQNLLAIQKSTGLKQDENATLFFWPSRLDNFQKGGQLLVDVIGRFVYDNPGSQVLVVADPTNEEDEGLQKATVNLALDSQGKIAYSSFDKDLSSFGYSAATAILSAPTFEPYGFFTPQGQACGDLVVTTKVGGGNDMVRPYDSTTYTGNGVHLARHSSDALYSAMRQTMNIHNHWKENDERYDSELRRIMKTVRKEQSIDSMITGYHNILKTMNGGPLV